MSTITPGIDHDRRMAPVPFAIRYSSFGNSMLLRHDPSSGIVVPVNGSHLEAVRFLTTRLGAIIREQAGERVFSRIERLRELSKAIRVWQTRHRIQAKRELVEQFDYSTTRRLKHPLLSSIRIASVVTWLARERSGKDAFIYSFDSGRDCGPSCD